MDSTPSLRKNVAALFAVQIAAYAPPLLTLPWLTRVLGPDNFGRLSFCVAVTGYFVLLADYGFNLSATRQIAVHSHNRVERSRIFWNTLTVKAILGIAGLPILLVLTICGRRFGEDRALLMINYLTVLGTILTPAWYFMGTERQTVLSGITILVRVASIPAIFLFVRTRHDVALAAFIPAGMTVVGGAICLIVLLKSRQLDRIRVDRNEIAAAFVDGWHLFLSTASISLYQATNTVVLGLVAGNAAVGHYTAAEKVVQACQGLLAPIGQSVYPRISRLMHDSRANAFALIRRVLGVQGSAALLVSALLFLFAAPAIKLLYGPDFQGSIAVLRWMAVIPLLVGLSNVFGIQTMLAMGMNRLVSRILMIAGAINVVVLFILTHFFGAAGAGMAIAGTELLVTITMALAVSRRQLPIFPWSVAESSST